MGCGESKPKLSLDDFKIIPDGASKEEVEKIEAVVDKKSITVLWEKKYPNLELTSKELDDLVPSPSITEENEEELFSAFRDKFLKLADRKRRLDALAKDPKPYLDQYFRERGAYAHSCLGTGFGNLWTIAMSGDKYYVRTQCEAWHKRTGVPLIAKSVDHHDIDGNGVLDSEEAQLFFKHLLECQVKYADDMCPSLTIAGIDLFLFIDKDCRENPARMAFVKNMIMKDLKPKLDYQCKALNDAFKSLINDEARMASGAKNAFALMDKNGDGKLQVDEVAEVLARDMGIDHWDEEDAKKDAKSSKAQDRGRLFFDALGLDTVKILADAGEEYDKAKKEKDEAEKKAKEEAEAKAPKEEAGKNGKGPLSKVEVPAPASVVPAPASAS